MNAREIPVVDGHLLTIDTVDFVRDLEGLQRLSDDWRRLECLQDGREAFFFQTHAWISHVARLRAAEIPGFRILVAAGIAGGLTRVVWPLALVRRAGIVEAVMLDDAFGQFAGLLAEPGVDIPAFVQTVLGSLRGLADGIRIAHLPQTSPLWLGLVVGGANVVASQPSVVIDFAGYRSFDAFNLAMRSKVRRILRNARSRLERGHAMQAVCGSDGAHVGEALGYAFAERVNWMKRRGRFTPAFHDPVFRKLLEEAPAAGLPCVGFCLKSSDVVISAQFGFVHLGRYYAYLSALNPAFKAFSAGRLHLGMVIEDCFGWGLAGLELMPPASRYKLEWNGTTRDLDTLSLALSPRGVALNLVLDRALPALRRTSRLAPLALRRLLVNLFNRS
jgi:CelD/BcsL family acetyltransferase involved in cellulose biosynthesis